MLVGAWYAEGGFLDLGCHISKFSPLVSRTIVTVATGACLAAFPQQSWATTEPSTGPIAGRVVDQLDAAVSATVVLVQEGSAVAEVQADESGRFVFRDVSSGRFWIEAYAAGFTRARTASFYAGSSEIRPVTIVLSVGPITQHVVVTASASELPEAQSGSPVSVLTSDALEQLGTPTLLAGLRSMPGTNVVETGGRGGTASLFLRGAASDFNKVLIDGIPVNDIGGAFDWGAITTTGIESVEVLRTSNSVLYGGDTLGGVINVITPRGRSAVPDVRYEADGGTFDTFRNELTVGGVGGRMDYFAAVSRFNTDNALPNNAYRNTTGVGRLGVLVGSGTDLSVTLRRVNTSYGSPGTVSFHGVADDSVQTNALTYAGVRAVTQVTNRLQTDIQFGSLDRAITFDNPTPTGQPYDPFGFGASYLGDQISIVGANGYQTTGRAILDYGGTYPSIFTSDTTRRYLSGRASYYITNSLELSGGARAEREAGISGAGVKTIRSNAGAFVEARGSLLNRLYLTGGVGVEENGLFGSAVTPRIAVAFYGRNPVTSHTIVGETKVTFNLGRGVKAPSVFDEQSALYGLLGPDSGSSTTFALDPIGPERSVNLDLGIEQVLAGGHVRVRLSYFDNRFSDLIEYVNKTALPQLGVPADVAVAVPFGATINASSYTARGVETAADVQARGFRFAGTYTFVDAEVTKSFSSSALTPAFNPRYPDIPIGQFSPLVGARPFRRPAHVASLFASYTSARMQVSVAGVFVGKSDGSTFLSDAFFGTSMLLPNRDLNESYQTLNFSAAYQLHSRLRWYVTIENLRDQDYSAVIGFPSLPRTLRTGVSVALGSR